MRRLLALPLALAACSSDPVDRLPDSNLLVDQGFVEATVDVPEDRPTMDAGPALCTPGMSTTCSCGALGTATYVCPPSGLAPVVCPCVDVDAALDAGDAAAPEDRSAPVDAVDAVAVADAADCATDVVSCRCPDGTESSHDVCLTEWCNCIGHEGAPDAGTDAAMDAADVQLVDAGVDVPGDRPDVGADVPRDAGPVDGGPAVYDLESARVETSYRVVYRRTGAAGDVTDCDSPPTATSCSVTSDTLRFSLRTCSTVFTGTFPISTTAGRSLSMFAGGGGSFAPTLRFEAGGRIAGSPARRSFHVQAAAPVQNGEPAVSGIPGRTVDPALADLWLLGCASD